MNKQEYKRKFHAVIEVYMEMKEGETLEEARKRMILELDNKTAVSYTCTHRCNIAKVYVWRTR